MVILAGCISACSKAADYYKMKVTLSQVYDPEDVSSDMDEHKSDGIVKFDRGNRKAQVVFTCVYRQNWTVKSVVVKVLRH